MRLPCVDGTFCVKYTPGGRIVDLQNRLCFTYEKITEVSFRADTEAQKNIVQRIETVFSTKKEHNIFYYADNIHLTHNTYSTYAWIRKGKYLEQPTESNRDRININGLLNAHDVTDVFSYEYLSINAYSSIALHKTALEKRLAAEKVYIIPDNTHYLNNKEVRKWLSGTKNKQIFLPPYPLYLSQ